MAPDDTTIGFANILATRKICSLVGNVPSEPREMVRYAARLSQYCRNVRQRLLDLLDQIITYQLCVRVPANLPCDENLTALRDDAIRIALRRLPSFRMQKFKVVHPNHRWRSLKR